jgi:hypothetical protein
MATPLPHHLLATPPSPLAPNLVKYAQLFQLEAQMSQTTNSGAINAMTLKEESLAENEELALQAAQEQMEFIFNILEEHGINKRLWLTEVLAVSESHGDNPPADIMESFLPWNLSPEAKERFSQDTFYTIGEDTFKERADGKIFHVQADGTEEEITFDEMTGLGFEKLAGIC